MRDLLYFTSFILALTGGLILAVWLTFSLPERRRQKLKKQQRRSPRR